MQYNIKKLISKLKKMPQNEPIVFDFGRAPKSFCSWRGIYKYPAITWGDARNPNSMYVKDFIEICEETIGKTFEGYKGGYFIMNENDPIWICEHQNYSGNLGICGVIYDGIHVVLKTEYCKY